MFDKELYWKRRNYIHKFKDAETGEEKSFPIKLRGQEYPPTDRQAVWTAEDVGVKKKIIVTDNESTSVELVTKEDVGKGRISAVLLISGRNGFKAINRPARRKHLKIRTKTLRKAKHAR